MDLTVGNLENKLREFKKGTSIHLLCGCCNHGICGGEDILKVRNHTNQTYGYIELAINDTAVGEVKLNPDEKEFYKNEVDKLKREVEMLKGVIEIYKDEIKSVERIPKSVENQLKYRYGMV